SESRLPSSTKSSVRYSRSAHSIALRVGACSSTACRGTPASHEALTSSVHISFAPRKSGARKQLSLAVAKQPERSVIDRLQQRFAMPMIPLAHATIAAPAGKQVLVPMLVREVPYALVRKLVDERFHFAAPCFRSHLCPCPYYTKTRSPVQTARAAGWYGSR